MSFILDALRKSDKRRRMGEGADLTVAAHEPAIDSPAPKRRGARGLVLGLLFLITLAAVAVVQRDRIEQQWVTWFGTETAVPDPMAPIVPEADGAGQPVDPAVAAYRERAQTPRERLVSDPDVARAEIERLVAAQNARTSAAEETEEPIDRMSPTPTRPGQSVSRAAAPRQVVQPPSVEETARIQRRLREAAARRQAESVASSDPGRSTVATRSQEEAVLDEVAQAATMVDPEERGFDDDDAQDPWTPAVAEYVRAWELPLSVRRNMPALTLNIHVFSELEGERFVLINGERYVGGDALPDGATLVDIRREGAVVDYRDYRFLLEP
ncbi:MAG: general secretion pathway protein GspB [Pseudomonadota bacterium]